MDTYGLKAQKHVTHFKKKKTLNKVLNTPSKNSKTMN